MVTKWLHRTRLKFLVRRAYYMLDPERLMSGDVILSTQKGAVSLLIRIGTRSPFSHASIYLGGGLYAEAVGLGVRVRPVATMIKNRMKVLRLAANSSRDPVATALKASESVNNYIHAPYWVTGAMLAIYRTTVLERRHRLFCSQLVAQAYEDAGLRIVPSLDPTKVTPASLAASSAFQDISASAVRRIWLIPDFVVGSHLVSLVDQETMMFQDMHLDAVDWFKERGIKVPQDWASMVLFLGEDSNESIRSELDLALMSVLGRHGYTKLLKDVVNRVLTPMEEWLEHFESLAIPDKQLATEYYFLEQALAAIETQAAIAEDNAKVYLELNARTPTSTFKFLALNEELRYGLAQRSLALTTTMMNAIWIRLPVKWREEAWAAYREQKAS
jgi:hypothetical protein